MKHSPSGWIMATTITFSHDESQNNLGRTALQLCAVIAVVLAINFVMSLRAAPSSSGVDFSRDLTSQASRIDRSLKEDRLTAVAPKVRAALPLGCERPFSALVKPLRPELGVRCLT
jgi:hypothetical protein